METKEKIKQLQQFLIQENIDVFYIGNDDGHHSEYLPEHYRIIRWLSGFTGSNATMVVTPKEACLWTDGRYFIQAENQLKQTGIELMKSGQPKVPTVLEYIEKKLKKGGVLGYNGKLVCDDLAIRFEELVNRQEATLKHSETVHEQLWTERPELNRQPLFVLADSLTGESVESKLKRIRVILKEKREDGVLLSALEDVAWTLNLRGRDILHTPVFYAHLWVGLKQAILYVDAEVMGREAAEHLGKAKVEIRRTEQLTEDLAKCCGVLSVDATTCSSNLVKTVPCEVCKETSMTVMMRAIKNKTELKNIQKAHVKDGVAVTQFIYWLKNNVGKIDMDELSASAYLDSCRQAQKNFIEPSFTSIVAYKANAAMMHYSATPQNNAKITDSGMLLVDSGGQYLQGTTDITRTIVLGHLDEKTKHYYTLVVQGFLRLMNAKFLHGSTGLNLDILARGVMWNECIDYQCGTGHGVGFVLGVHEGPHSIRRSNTTVVLEEGMTVTDEPGIYLENEVGIRVENQLYVKKSEENFYGQFLEFGNFTLAPIDLDGLNLDEMSQAEKQQLDAYHQRVYEEISPYLTSEQKTWLKIQTRKVS